MTQFDGNSLAVQGIEGQNMPLNDLDRMCTVAMQPSQDTIRLFQASMARPSAPHNVNVETIGSRACPQQKTRHVHTSSHADIPRQHTQQGSTVMSTPYVSQPIVCRQHCVQMPTDHDVRPLKDSVPLHTSDLKQVEIPPLTLRSLSESLVQALAETSTRTQDSRQPQVHENSGRNESLRQTLNTMTEQSWTKAPAEHTKESALTEQSQTKLPAEHVKTEVPTQATVNSQTNVPSHVQTKLPHGSAITQTQSQLQVLSQGTMQPTPHLQATVFQNTPQTQPEAPEQNDANQNPSFQSSTGEVSTLPNARPQTAAQPAFPQEPFTQEGIGDVMGTPMEWPSLTSSADSHRGTHLPEQPWSPNATRNPLPEDSIRTPGQATPSPLPYSPQASFQTQSGITELIVPTEPQAAPDAAPRQNAIPSVSQNAFPAQDESHVMQQKQKPQQSPAITSSQVPHYHAGNRIPDPAPQIHHDALQAMQFTDVAPHTATVTQPIHAQTITTDANLNTPIGMDTSASDVTPQTEATQPTKPQLCQPPKHHADAPATENFRQAPANDAFQSPAQQPFHGDSAVAQTPQGHVLPTETPLPQPLMTQSADKHDGQLTIMDAPRQKTPNQPPHSNQTTHGALMSRQETHGALMSGPMTDHMATSGSQSIPIQQEAWTRPEDTSKTAPQARQDLALQGKSDAGTVRPGVPQKLQKHGATTQAHERAAESQLQPQADTQPPVAIPGADAPVPMVPVAQAMAPAQIPVANLAISAAEILAQTVDEVTETMLTRMDPKTGVGEIRLILKPTVLGGTEIRMVGDAKHITITFFTYDATITSLITSNHLYLSEAVAAKTQATVKLSVIDVLNRKRSNALA